MNDPTEHALREAAYEWACGDGTTSADDGKLLRVVQEHGLLPANLEGPFKVMEIRYYDDETCVLIHLQCTVTISIPIREG